MISCLIPNNDPKNRSSYSCYYQWENQVPVQVTGFPKNKHTAEAEIQTQVWVSWFYLFSNLPGYFRSPKNFLCSYTWNNINLLKDMQG